MKQEDKDLLLKDLCARLPYKNLKVRGVFFNYNKDINRCQYEECDSEFKYVDLKRYETLKPYLFPLSSMTEEQEEEYNNLNGYELGCFPHTEEALDYLIKNNFDHRGLIPKGLAIDATNLNIY